MKWEKTGGAMFMRFKSSRAHLFVNIYVSHDTFCNSFTYIFSAPFCFTCRHYTRRLCICGLAKFALITTRRKRARARGREWKKFTKLPKKNATKVRTTSEKWRVATKSQARTVCILDFFFFFSLSRVDADFYLERCIRCSYKKWVIKYCVVCGVLQTVGC